VRNLYNRGLYNTTVLRHDFRGRFGAGADCTGPYRPYNRGMFFKAAFGTVFEKNIVQGG
jgi:hypothetical protein